MRRLLKGRFEIAWYVLAFVVICSYLALAEGAVAGDKSFQLHVMSQHFDDTGQDRNENNWGVGFTHLKESGIVGYTTGIYNNSHYNTSVYIGGVYKPEPYMSFNLVGVTGYDDGTVILSPTISAHFLPRTNMGPVLTVGPTSEGFVALLSLEWRLGPE